MAVGRCSLFSLLDRVWNVTLGIHSPGWNASPTEDRTGGRHGGPEEANRCGPSLPEAPRSRKPPACLPAYLPVNWPSKLSWVLCCV